MKYFSFLILIISNIALAENSCPEVNLPSEIAMKEEAISLSTTIDVSGDGTDLGFIKARLLSLTTTFSYFSAKKELVFTGRQEIFSWGTSIDLTDCNGKHIGRIKENVVDNFLTFYTTFTLYNELDQEVAHSVKTELISTKFEILDLKGDKAAVLTRPWLRFTDQWNVSIKSTKIDPRLFMMIGAYKTESDRKKKKASQD